MAEIVLLHAGREGQTRRICECMASCLESEGWTVSVLDLSDSNVLESVTKSRYLIIGASVHYGHLPASLYRFIEQNRQLLAARSNAFFCVNLTARKPGKDTPQGSAYMRTFLRKSSWRPQRLAVFAGALLYRRYVWYDRVMIRFIMWMTGGPTDTRRDVEFTDWDRVRSVARDWGAHQGDNHV